MSNTISGDVNAGLGAGDSANPLVSCASTHAGSSFQTQVTQAQVYSFTGLPPGTYIISASTSPIATGPHAGWVYRQSKVVTIDFTNPQDQLNVNLFPTAPNAPNS